MTCLAGDCMQAQFTIHILSKVLK